MYACSERLYQRECILQVNATTKSYADFLCTDFGMNRQSERCENLVLLTFREVTDLSGDLHDVDQQVDKSLKTGKDEESFYQERVERVRESS